MRNKKLDNVTLGLFVMAGLSFLVLTLYMISANRNLLGSTFIIKAVVTNVNGLVPGNNVRFKGIDVGTVDDIELDSDTAIYVTLLIDDRYKKYIRKNAIATISSDGLMGNKLLNINSQPGAAALIEAGDVIQSLQPVETDEMLRTLNTTNQNLERITRNIFDITNKLNNSKSFWSILSDTGLTADLRHAVADLRKAGANTSAMTERVRDFALQLEQGDGLVQQLFTDSTLVLQWRTALQEVQNASHNTTAMMQDLRDVARRLKEGEGSAGLLLADTVMRNKLLNTATNLEQGTRSFNQNMDALKESVLLRKYFKKLEKEKK